VKILGEGGMSVVYDAIDTTCERKVAVKVIRPRYAGTGGFSKEQMRREAAVLVKLHEQTEFVVDVLTSGITDDGHHLPFYVMERLRGDSLRRFMSDQLRRDVDFTIDEIAGIGIPVAVALAHAHALGVVHRDTKPENVFMAVTQEGRVVVKVLDFGICSRAEDEHVAGWFAGTLAYAAPEQLECRPPLAATDVYSLGLLLFELATLKLPHGRHRPDLNLEHLARAVMKNPAPDLATLRLDTPPQFAQLVARCLAIDPAARPSAPEVARVLRDIRMSFLGDLSGAPESEGAATEVTGAPGEASRTAGPPRAPESAPQEILVVAGSEAVDLGASTDVAVAFGQQVAAESNVRLGDSSRVDSPAVDESVQPPAPSATEGLVEPAHFGSALVPAPIVTFHEQPAGPEDAQVQRQGAPPTPALAERGDAPDRVPDPLAENRFVRELVQRSRDSHDRSAGPIVQDIPGSDIPAPATRPSPGSRFLVWAAALSVGAAILGGVAIGVRVLGNRRLPATSPSLQQAAAVESSPETPASAAAPVEPPRPPPAAEFEADSKAPMLELHEGTRAEGEPPLPSALPVGQTVAGRPAPGQTARGARTLSQGPQSTSVAPAEGHEGTLRGGLGDLRTTLDGEPTKVSATKTAGAKPPKGPATTQAPLDGFKPLR